MAKAEENLMAWLRNAHAMEEQAVTMLTSLASRTGDYPDVKARIESHLGETKRQAEALEECIKRRGGDTSTLKDLAGKVIAFGQGRAACLSTMRSSRARWQVTRLSTWRRQHTGY
jgi:ferritin-like metal-binding protein YciE